MAVIGWSIIETNVGIICACIPVIHRPLAKLMVKVWSTSKKKIRTILGLKAPLPAQHPHWLSLEPLEASRPSEASRPICMTNVITRPRAPLDDDVESLNYIHKTTDISVQYDRPQSSPNVRIWPFNYLECATWRKYSRPASSFEFEWLLTQNYDTLHRPKSSQQKHTYMLRPELFRKCHFAT